MARVFLSALTASIVVSFALPVSAQGGKKSSGASGANVPAVVVSDCGSLQFQDGRMTCSCPAGATSSGSVWGSGPYTGDSAICRAAVHAGVISAAGGVVDLVQAPGQDSYEASVANGVTTSGWGSYGESFDFAGITRTPVTATSDLPACTTMPTGVDLYDCYCEPDGVNKSIWGNDPYTSDSDICTAARHVGYIDAADGGDVYVLRLQGLASYYGDENNGITSGAWDSYGSSIIFDWNR